MSATIQDRLEIESIEDGIGLFGTSDLARSVAILDVVGADASLATADDATQEEILAGRAQFLNAQMAPFQVVARAEQVDLEGHLRRVRDRAELLPEPLASVARDYAAFVQGLGHRRTLLDRHCYVVVPDKEPTPAVTLGDGFDGYWVAVRAMSQTRSRPRSAVAFDFAATRYPGNWGDPGYIRTA